MSPLYLSSSAIAQSATVAHTPDTIPLVHPHDALSAYRLYPQSSTSPATGITAGMTASPYEHATFVSAHPSSSLSTRLVASPCADTLPLLPDLGVDDPGLPSPFRCIRVTDPSASACAARHTASDGATSGTAPVAPSPLYHSLPLVPHRSPSVLASSDMVLALCRNMTRPLTTEERMALSHFDRLRWFLSAAPSLWSLFPDLSHPRSNPQPPPDPALHAMLPYLSAPHPSMRRFHLSEATNDHVTCVQWRGSTYITGTDIVRALVFRFNAFGRPVVHMKKFEEGVFSDLRNLKPGMDATLEEPKSPFLDLLYKFQCIRTQKKQKVFYWASVPHNRLFFDALERDLSRDSTTVPMREPALSFTWDRSHRLYDQFANAHAGLTTMGHPAVGATFAQRGTDGGSVPSSPSPSASPCPFTLCDGTPGYKQRRKRITRPGTAAGSGPAASLGGCVVHSASVHAATFPSTLKRSSTSDMMIHAQPWPWCGVQQQPGTMSLPVSPSGSVHHLNTAGLPTTQPSVSRSRSSSPARSCPSSPGLGCNRRPRRRPRESPYTCVGCTRRYTRPGSVTDGLGCAELELESDGDVDANLVMGGLEVKREPGTMAMGDGMRMEMAMTMEDSRNSVLDDVLAVLDTGTFWTGLPTPPPSDSAVPCPDASATQTWPTWVGPSSLADALGTEGAQSLDAFGTAKGEAPRSFGHVSSMSVSPPTASSWCLGDEMQPWLGVTDDGCGMSAAAMSGGGVPEAGGSVFAGFDVDGSSYAAGEGEVGGGHGYGHGLGSALTGYPIDSVLSRTGTCA